MTTAPVTMDIWHKVLAVVLIVALLGASALGYYAVKNHEEAALAAQANVLLAQEAKDLATQEATLEATTAKQLAAQQASFDAQMKTAQGQLQFLQQQVASLKSLPTPIVVTGPATPGAPTVVTIPAADLPQVDADLLQFSQLKVAYPACTAELAKEKQQLSDVNQELVNLKKVGHPSAWSRVKSATKFIAIGVGFGIGIALLVK